MPLPVLSVTFFFPGEGDALLLQTFGGHCLGDFGKCLLGQFEKQDGGIVRAVVEAVERAARG